MSPYNVPMQDAQTLYPDYTFISPLTPSEQKAAFHVQDSDGNDCCLKIIAPNYDIERLRREILALQSISSPNVAKLIEYENSTKRGVQRHYIVEEFIEGTDFTARLVPRQQWSTAEAVTFFSQLCDGLAALSAINVVHRDLKPNNIRVRPNGSPVIIDFGLVRHLDLTSVTSTSDGAAIGTPIYFSPEQFSGTKHDIDHRTDLFALGILIYQAMTGEHPFFTTGMSRNDLRDAICVKHDCLSNSKYLALDDDWKIIISKLLEKERSNRPFNAEQVGRIIRKIGGI